MDRWCKRCNAYRTTVRCSCGEVTDKAMVVPGPALTQAPKVRCGGCHAPLESYRFVDHSGFGFRHQAKLAGADLYIHICVEDPALEQKPWALVDEPAWEVKGCPHCQRPLLRVGCTNNTGQPITTTAELGTRQDEGIVLVITVENGERKNVH